MKKSIFALMGRSATSTSSEPFELEAGPEGSTVGDSLHRPFLLGTDHSSRESD